MKRSILFIVFICFLSIPAGLVGAKEADLAGIWYSDSPEELRSEIDGYLSNALIGDIEGRIIGCIAPHAGIRFSGAVAAYTYKALASQNPKKVIVVGFSHKLYIPGCIAVFSEKSFDTPMGCIPVNTDISERLLAYNSKIIKFPKAFASENSIELQLLFIQRALKNAEVVLVAMCDQDKALSQFLSAALSDVLEDEKDFVIVASSDMCHYLPYFAAEKKDKDTIAKIKTFDPELFYEGSLKSEHKLMCGYGAVYSVMEATKKLGADESVILKYANSGDFEPMTRNSVVGYVSALFTKKEASDENLPEELSGKDKEGKDNMLNEAERKELLKIARDAINLYLETGQCFDAKTSDETLKEKMGAFVTLHKNGRLRGCIGHVIAEGALYLTVRDMAIASAAHDTRFSPVSAGEMKDIDIEISVLSPMEKITDYEKIVMGKHGVMVKEGFKSGIYLPQVADETGWTREEFMDSLSVNKAGIGQNLWKTGKCEIYIFTAEVFGEKEK